MIAHIRPAQLAEWIAAAPEGARPLVLDVREAWELQTASVAPADFELVTIPMGEIPARIAELDPTRPMACLCHHGMRSLRVADFLERQGFEHVANITGGIDAWSQEVAPSVPRY
ncbi:rhodanese-like domain-containing protein [Diaphorobacter aerolatus]|uniref:Sulfurtransferase n=1 Tax=Diaphorobacter aerolatus TaxID=1288495 RepID=A0A7H0GKV6_9BURK|nr:rhodanese-like domain-containing protein [Diaphorobacter aerolatus]QNP48922.1 sulfurtransferase [Diaphorobacter aerolatus]